MVSKYPNQNVNLAYVDPEVYNSHYINYVNNPTVNYSQPSAPPHPSAIPESQLRPRSVEYTQVKSISKNNNKSNTNKKAVVLCVVISILIVLAIVICVVLYALMPCIFVRCHSKARCINSLFNARCVCNFGYSGNGKSKCDECGIRMKQPNLRIIGGTISVDSSWPEAAYITFSYSTKVREGNELIQINYSSFCGATLINHRHVLTAAHCIPNKIRYDNSKPAKEVQVTLNNLYPTYESMVKVYLGVYNRSFSAKATAKRQLSVDKIIKYDRYDSKILFNDIAILRLDRVVDLDENIQVACLPREESRQYPLPSSDAWIIGWGDTENKTSSIYLKNAKIVIYDSTQCYGVSNTLPKSWDTQICAGDTKNKIDTCQGDSGGGLFVKDTVNNSTKFILAGITSYGEGCAIKPGIYTRSSFYLDWIQKNIDF